MSLGPEVTFAGNHIFFPAGHPSRIGGTFDGTLTAAAIRDVSEPVHPCAASMVPPP